MTLSGILLLAGFALFAILMVKRLLPTLLALPLEDFRLCRGGAEDCRRAAGEKAAAGRFGALYQYGAKRQNA